MSRNALPRVAFISHSSWLAGAERALLNLLEHLPQGAIQPIAVFPRVDGPAKSIARDRLGLPVFELQYSFSIPLADQAGFASKVRREIALFTDLYIELELDAVVVNTSVIYPAAAAAIQAGIPLLLHSHGILTPQLFPAQDLLASHWLVSLQLSIADQVLVPSDWVGIQYLRENRLAHPNIAVLPNGTKLPVLHSAVDTADIPSLLPNFVMLCTLEPNKGVGTFLEAAAAVLAKRPACATFTVYGDGSPEYRDMLMKYIAKHNLQHSCFLHPKQEDVDTIYRNCRAAIVASDVESFSIVAIEAMSYAKPVIATRCGGPEDIILDHKTGFLIPCRDSKTLAEKIILLMDNPHLGHRMGYAGRERVRENYDIEKIARTYLDYIIETITNNASVKLFDNKRFLLELIDFETSHKTDRIKKLDKKSVNIALPSAVTPSEIISRP